ncbi:DNA polymerase IV [Paenibacillus sp. N1-5-1-14]|uniref:DNA polymerase IV n=1 Tax=Paenibacillus radicibacter TaxID=2972488 RepID=UPI002158AB32|nr:DNA polymerase IV [Paenibacillus radicibacter]MCR8643902.1 DNA polymerase IV [Paenibacillus radicibacter]
MMKSSSSYPKNGRVILHIDMNAFYCSVHEAVEPESYKGKAIAVSGSVEQRKGIIVTSSYAARAKGVKTGMHVREALKRCPELILLQPDFDLYREYSRAFMKIVYAYSPLVEPVSIDECYVDITGSKQFGTPLEISTTIQQRVLSELGLPCSIGVAPNKLLAKMASDMKKPNGLTVLRLRDVPNVMWQRPCVELFGIGRKTAEKLERIGIRTIGELAHADIEMLSRHFGITGPALKNAAAGIDHSPVNPNREQNKSIGHTTTLPHNIQDRAAAVKVLLNLADGVARRMRRQKLVTETVQLTIRDPDMHTVTRSMTIAPTDITQDIYHYACMLLDKHWKVGDPIRLLGVTAQNLSSKMEKPLQLDLFEYEELPKKEKLTEVMDAIRDKFGENAVVTLGMVSDDPSTLLRNPRIRGTSLQMDHLKQRPLSEEE